MKRFRIMLLAMALVLGFGNFSNYAFAETDIMTQGNKIEDTKGDYKDKFLSKIERRKRRVELHRRKERIKKIFDIEIKEGNLSPEDVDGIISKVKARVEELRKSGDKEKIRQEVTKIFEDILNDAVKNGVLTREKADRIIKRIQDSTNRHFPRMERKRFKRSGERITNRLKEILDKRVKDGILSREEADEILKEIKERVKPKR